MPGDKEYPGYHPADAARQYEIKILMLFVARATKLIKEQKLQSYECATNVQGFGAFGDLVAKIQYKDRDENVKVKTLCVHARHTSNKNEDITKRDLDSRFNLTKFTKSYNKIKSKNSGDFVPIFYTNIALRNEFTTCVDENLKTQVGGGSIVHDLLGTSNNEVENVRVFNVARNEVWSLLEERKITYEFLKSMILYSNQASTIQLDDVIKETLLEIFPDEITKGLRDEIFIEMSHVFEEMWNDSRYIRSTSNTIEKIRIDTLLKFETKYFISKFSEEVLEFNGTSKFMDELDLEETEKFISINSSCKILTLKKIDSYFQKKDKDTIVLRQDSFLQIVPFCQYIDSKNLVIIVDSCGKELDSSVLEFLKFNPNSKIILVETDAKNPKIPSDIFYLNEFKEESQTIILNKTITFQGYSVNLEKLLQDEFCKFSFDSETFSLLLKEELKIADNIESLKDVADYYIPRIMSQPFVKKEILKYLDIKDIFLVANITEQEIGELLEPNQKFSCFNNIEVEKSNVIIYKKESENYDDEYRELCMKYRKTCKVHLLRKEGNYLVWENSSGNVNIIRKYLLDENSEIHEENFMKSRMGKSITLISDEAGMGKSVLLTNIALKIKEENPEKLVLKIKLNCVLPSLKNMKEVRPARSIDVINKLTNSTNIITDHMISNVSQNVHVLLDGYDEVCPTYSSTVLDIVKLLTRDGISVYMTSRPNMLDEAIEELSSLPFGIKQFTVKNQVDFLLRYWNSQISNKGEGKLDIPESTADVVRKKHMKMMGTPLLIYFVGTIYKSNIRKMLSDGAKSLSDFHDVNNIRTIYEKFISEKIQNYYEKNKKVGNIKSVVESVYLKLRSLAVETISTDICNENLNIHDYVDTKPITSDEEFIKECKDIGLLTETSTNQILFIHQTIAEHLFAEFILKKISQESSESNLKLLILFLKSEEFWSLRLFLNKILDCSNMTPEFKNKLGQLIISTEENLIGISLREENFNIYSYLKNCLLECKYEIADRVFQLNEDGYNILHVICKGKIRNEDYVLNEIEKLLSQVVDNSVDKYVDKVSKARSLRYVEENGTALHFASKNGYANIVESLLKYKAKVKIFSSNGQTALMLAAENGHNDVLTKLLDAGAEVNGVDDFYDMTALMHAASKYNNEIVKTLLEKGADVNLKNSRGKTALMLAAHRNYDNKDIIISLLKKGIKNINEIDKKGKTALLYAASSGNKNVLSKLLNHGADIKSIDNDGYTALMFAAENGHVDVVKTLLDEKVDINIEDKHGFTALMFAVFFGNIEVVKTLLERRLTPVINLLHEIDPALPRLHGSDDSCFDGS